MTGGCKVIELIATLCGLIQGVLILFSKRESWFFYILNIAFLIAFSFQAKLYGDVFENAIYLLIGFFGLFAWYSKYVSSLFEKFIQMRYSNRKEIVVFTLAISLISVATYGYLVRTDDPFPLLDSITTGMGFVATLMMAIKRIDAWIIWLIDDILMACIYFLLPSQGCYLMILNIVWIFLAIGSWWNWHRIWRKQR